MSRAVPVTLSLFALTLALAGCDGPSDPEPDAVSKPILCEGHTGWVAAVAVSPDGKLVVSGSEDGTLRFWDAADGKAIRTVKLFDPSVKGQSMGPLAFSPDGKTLAATGFKKGRGELLFYDPATGKPAAVRWPGREGGCGVRFSPDGKALAVGGSGAVRVWGFPKGDKLHEFPLPRSKWGGVGRAKCVAFSPDGKRLAAALSGAGGPHERSGPLVRVWDLATGKLVFSAKDEADANATAVAFSPNGRLLAFTCFSQNGSALFVSRLNGSHLRQLTRFSLHVGNKEDWSPDSRRIMFISAKDESTPNAQVNTATIRPDGTGLF